MSTFVSVGQSSSGRVGDVIVSFLRLQPSLSTKTAGFCLARGLTASSKVRGAYQCAGAASPLRAGHVPPTIPPHTHARTRGPLASADTSCLEPLRDDALGPRGRGTSSTSSRLVRWRPPSVSNPRRPITPVSRTPREPRPSARPLHAQAARSRAHLESHPSAIPTPAVPAHMCMFPPPRPRPQPLSTLLRTPVRAVPLSTALA